MILAALTTAVIALAVFLLWQGRRRTDSVLEDKALTNERTKSNPYEDIEPLHNFDWSTTEPIKMRPFKPKYHLTMALENIALSDLVAMDKTYSERMALRKFVMDAHTWETVRCNPACEPAAIELYEWMVGTYLPRRFPTIYKFVEASELPSNVKTQGRHLYNVVGDKYLPLKAPSALEALYTLGHNVDDEFLILLPSSTAEDGSPIYHLQAYVTCFPSGFSTPDKFEQPLAGIHKPVPGYKAKLEKSMDRFFAKLEVGKIVKRANWSITTDSELYKLSGNHMYAGGTSESHAQNEAISNSHVPLKNEKTLDVSSSGLDEIIEDQKKDVRIEDCRLRCERQTLHRLEHTKAIVFAFKTYQYTLQDVKDEGSGPDLAAAIEGLTQGSVPDMAYYKRQVVWGEKVCEFLRS